MDLEDRWPLPDPVTHPLRDRLVKAYREPARGYHDQLHLHEVLDRLGELLEDPGPEDGAGSGSGPDRVTLELAAWFHDAVYDDQGDLEERSARLAEAELPLRGVPAPVVAEVARLVRLTATHAPGPDDRSGQLLCDADLAILAAGPERYAAYTAGVRREYAHLDEATFAAGRAAVLEQLLVGRLFHTDLGRERWEAAARANVTRELAELRR
jgi:predicted metal-dependent HD superfamily phosphohydrolase